MVGESTCLIFVPHLARCTRIGEQQTILLEVWIRTLQSLFNTMKCKRVEHLREYPMTIFRINESLLPLLGHLTHEVDNVSSLQAVLLL